MDNNNQVQPQSVNTGPAPAPVPVVPTPSAGDSNKMILWLIIGFVIVIGLVGGVYFFLSRQQTANTAQTIDRPITQVTKKPPETVDALDKDLSALNVDNSDSDFATVDQDLQQL